MTEAPDFVAAEIAKAEGERVRITVGSFKGRPTVDVRLWYDAGADTYRPSKSGVTLAARHLVALKRGIDAACEEARRRGVLDAEPGPETEGAQ